MKYVIVFSLIAVPALAECPDAPDISEPINGLLEQVQAAPDAASGRQIAARMWKHWTDAPDAAAQALLDDGMARLGSQDFGGALTALDALVEYCPNYAEGYNQRAFAHYLTGEYAAALPDLDRALELSPTHVPAMSGKGLTLIQMGRIVEGQDAIREAVALNPWLGERALLQMDPETGQPKPQETDL